MQLTALSFIVTSLIYYLFRYNSTTGEFTVPFDGAGLYFFYISFRLDSQESASLSITKNGGEACRAGTDFDNAGNDGGMISCGTIQLVAEGSDLRFKGVLKLISFVFQTLKF